MASLKDKLKSRMKAKNEPETMESFDETSLSLQLVQGKHQLSEIRVHCSWTNNKVSLKPPRLFCRWYNRTQKNYEEITGISSESYQPSILDLSSTIEVTCIPELPGINYEGMPILLKSQPITLAPETENEANKLYETGKGKFLVSVVEGKFQVSTAQGQLQVPVAAGAEALLQVQKGQLTLLFLKSKEQHSRTVAIEAGFPQVTISRKHCCEVRMVLKPQQSCLVTFKNNEARDAFCLFLRIFLAKRTLLNEAYKPAIPEPVSEVPLPSSESPKKEEPLATCKGEALSSEYLAESNSAGEGGSKQSSATDLLRLVSLKEQLQRVQSWKGKTEKQLQLEKQKVFDLENKVQQISERLENASKNYFVLQQELTASLQLVKELNLELDSFKSIEGAKNEEFFYYKNQIKLVNDEKTLLREELAVLRSQCEDRERELSQLRDTYGAKGDRASYEQLLGQLRDSQDRNTDLKLRNQFCLQQNQRLEETLGKQSSLIEQLQSANKHTSRRYESLTNQLNSSSVSPSSCSSRKERELEPCSSSFECAELVLEQDSFLRVHLIEHQEREKQLLKLKSQLRDYVEENHHLRTLLSKEKKPSSRTYLKLELFEARKIVSRLSEAITEKQSLILNLREINKELNRRMLAMGQEGREGQTLQESQAVEGQKQTRSTMSEN